MKNYNTIGNRTRDLLTCSAGPQPNELIRHKNIINHIKAQRLSWFGHLHRMPEERTVKNSIQVETDVNTTTRETKEQMGR